MKSIGRRFGFGLAGLLLIGLGLLQLMPSLRYRAVVIHHTASESGNYASIRSSHLRRGWADAAYHLILSNGRSGVPVGHLEATGRYLTRAWSVATRDVGCNARALHLSVVGNFETETIAPDLRAALGSALEILVERLHLEPEDILLHGEDCSPSACPGRFLPANEIRGNFREWASSSPASIRSQQSEVIGGGPTSVLAWSFLIGGLAIGSLAARSWSNE